MSILQDLLQMAQRAKCLLWEHWEGGDAGLPELPGQSLLLSWQAPGSVRYLIPQNKAERDKTPASALHMHECVCARMCACTHVPASVTPLSTTFFQHCRIISSLAQAPSVCGRVLQLALHQSWVQQREQTVGWLL